jgi:hypothetical protein
MMRIAHWCIRAFSFCISEAGAYFLASASDSVRLLPYNGTRKAISEIVRRGREPAILARVLRFDTRATYLMLGNLHRPRHSQRQGLAGATMERFRTLAIALIVIEFGCPASVTLGQGAKELVGTWSLVSITVNQDGQKVEPFGANPRGSLVFERNGRFSLTVTRSDLPKFSSNNRQTGTPQENKAIVQGSIAYFGTYSVREEERLFIVHVEGSTFPNWVGTDQKRLFTIAGDELKYTNSSPSSGPGTALVVWKRVN